jgi:hypothetical protein
MAGPGNSPRFKADGPGLMIPTGYLKHGLDEILGRNGPFMLAV